MKKPTNRDGLSATAFATESASPGRLAINAALPTPCLSSSAIHRALSASVESGNSQPSAVIADRSAPSAGEEARRKKVDVRVANHAVTPSRYCLIFTVHTQNRITPVTINPSDRPIHKP